MRHKLVKEIRVNNSNGKIHFYNKRGTLLAEWDFNGLNVVWSEVAVQLIKKAKICNPKNSGKKEDAASPGGGVQQTKVQICGSKSDMCPDVKIVHVCDHDEFCEGKL